jgi:hypothetical protein
VGGDAFGLDLDPLESFVCDRDLAGRSGSVTTAASARQRVTNASAPILECSSSTTQAMTSLPAARPT